MFAVLNSKANRWGCAACSYLNKTENMVRCKLSKGQINELRKCPLGA